MLLLEIIMYLRLNPPYRGMLAIGNRNIFGVSSSVIQGIKIGSGNVIGMGSVVLRKIADNSHMFGNPAKKII
jgi:UDP-N-acetylbacillosamine N-acetyltransferase